MSEAPRGVGPEALVAVATDAGGWRVLEPVIGELQRRGRLVMPMLVGKAAELARRAGVEYVALDGATRTEQAAQIVRAFPAAILLGTSVGEVVEWEVARHARWRAPTLGVLDAMLFVEQRFGARLEAMPNVVASPDRESAARLVALGAAPERVIVTGNPTLEAIGVAEAGGASLRELARGSQGGPGGEASGELLGEASSDWAGPAPDGPLDVLFVSQPVVRIGWEESPFAIDERASLAHVLAALADLAHLAPHGYRVRVRPHPVERLDGLPTGSGRVAVEVDDDPDRIRSVRRARVVVGLSSSLLAEARMLPRSAIAYLPGPYWAREPVFAAEQGVRVVSSVRALRDAIAGAIQAPPAPAPNEAHRGATARIADLALQLAKRGATAAAG